MTLKMKYKNWAGRIVAAELVDVEGLGRDYTVGVRVSDREHVPAREITMYAFSEAEPWELWDASAIEDRAIPTDEAFDFWGPTIYII